MPAGRTAAPLIVAALLFPLFPPGVSALHSSLECPPSVVTPDEGTVPLFEGRRVTGYESEGRNTWECNYSLRGRHDAVFVSRVQWYEAATPDGTHWCDPAYLGDASGGDPSSFNDGYENSATHDARVFFGADDRDSHWDAAREVGQELLRQAEEYAWRCSQDAEPAAGDAWCPGEWDFGNGERLPLTDSGDAPPGWWEEALLCHYGEGDPYYGVEGARRVTVFWNPVISGQARREGTAPCALLEEPHGDGFVYSRHHQVRASYEPTAPYPSQDAEIIALGERLVRTVEPFSLLCENADPFWWYDEARAEECRRSVEGFYAFHGTRDNEVQGHVVDTQGVVELQRYLPDGPSSWQPVLGTTPMRPGDMVRAAKDARVVVVLSQPDAPAGARPNVVIVGAESTICIGFHQPIEPERTPSSDGSVAWVLTGIARAWTNFVGGIQILSMRAGKVTLTQDGTETVLEYDPATDTAIASYLHGNATLTVDGVAVEDFAEGTQVVIEGTTVGEPVTLSAEDLAALRALTAEPAKPPPPGFLGLPAAPTLAALAALALAAAVARSRRR